ncbi:MAG: nucleoside triphosphate pyrophosphohydrolase [Myxococcales bacterium]|nr:nucleoside triphosphate pyrophosphohydrolase [Myxococcales bacterium]USN50350.1 MAG: nucleoside triphosphate pyrophosphohydrolase [Myxococcales bacterium]
MKYIFRCEKLVRDRIPELIAQPSTVIEVETLNHKAHIDALKAKLIEEANKILETASREKLIEEIADIQEVLDALVLKLSIKGSDVEKIKRQKNMRNGGFDRGLFLKSVETPCDSQVATLFLQEPKKYPHTRLN